jgi:uncharacterized membrane protein
MMSIVSFLAGMLVGLFLFAIWAYFISVQKNKLYKEQMEIMKKNSQTAEEMVKAIRGLRNYYP